MYHGPLLPRSYASWSPPPQELCITVRRGSAALRRSGGAREAYDEYRKALQQVAKYSKELNLSANELISLRSVEIAEPLAVTGY